MRKLLFILFGFLISSLFGQENVPHEVLIPAGSRLQASSLSTYHLDSLSINNQIDSIITNGIKNQSFPGAQVLIAKDGNIIFHEAYGFHTYDSFNQ